MEEIGKSILSTSCILRRSMDKEFLDLGITSSQARIIKFIYDRKEVTACEIENYFNLTKATVSTHINTLEELDYIKREQDFLDARKKIIKLTKKGDELRKAIKKLIENNENYLNSILSEDEKVALDNVLEKIRGKLKEEKHV